MLGLLMSTLSFWRLRIKVSLSGSYTIQALWTFHCGGFEAYVWGMGSY